MSLGGRNVGGRNNKTDRITKRAEQIFEIRLGSGVLETVAHMKIIIDSSKRAVKDNVRRFITEQRALLESLHFLSDETGLYITHPKSSWQAAPHFVPEDMQSVNGTTKLEQWPMPSIEMELCNLNGSIHFESLAITAGY